MLFDSGDVPAGLFDELGRVAPEGGRRLTALGAGGQCPVPLIGDLLGLVGEEDRDAGLDPVSAPQTPAPRPGRRSSRRS
jgi:hypothetical protein